MPNAKQLIKKIESVAPSEVKVYEENGVIKARMAIYIQSAFAPEMLAQIEERNLALTFKKWYLQLNRALVTSEVKWHVKTKLDFIKD